MAARPLILPRRKLLPPPRPCFKPWVWVPRKPARCVLALDATGTESFVNTSPTSVNYTGFTMGTVSNGALIITLVMSTLTDAGVAMTWDSVSMAKIISKNTTGANGVVQLWGLVAPHAGNKTLAITGITAGTVDIYIDGISFSGVDQTGGATTFYGAVSANGTTSGADTLNPGSITTASGDATVDAGILTVGGSISAHGASQTVLFDDGSGSVSEGFASFNVGTAAPSFSWTTNAAGSVWANAATSVKAAAGSTIKFRRTLSSLGARAGSRQLMAG